MTPIELTIIIVALIVALAVPWVYPGAPNPWTPTGYSVSRWLLCIVLVVMLCFMWLRH